MSDEASPRAERLRSGSLRVRTVVAVLLLLAVLLAGLAVAVEAILGAQLRGQLEDRLRDRAAAAAALVGTVSSDDLAERLSAQGLSVRIIAKDGGLVTAGPTPAQLRAGPKAGAGLDAPLPGRGGAGRGSGAGDSGAASTSTASARVVSSKLTADGDIVTLTSRLSDASTIVLTTDAGAVTQTLTQLRGVMIGASAAFLLLAAGGLVLVVRATMRPLERMTGVAVSISSGDRGRRLRPTRPRTEIGRVAVAFDDMLDAVEGAEQRALDAEERVRSFVSDAAHELRTPVAGMRAAAETLVRAPTTVDERERLATHVVREAGRASRLVNDMLTMSLVDRGLTLQLVDVDLDAIVGEEVERQRLRRPGLDLRMQTTGPGSQLVGDPERLTQVIANLLDNAAQATNGTGSVALTLSSTPSRVTLTVADDGPGVPERDRERIFDRLVRLDAGRSRAAGGAGLGLTIARGIARAHGGDLRCLPSSDGGLFSLELPRGGQ